MPNYLVEFSAGKDIHSLFYDTDNLTLAKAWFKDEVWDKQDEAEIEDRLFDVEVAGGSRLVVDVLSVSWVRFTVQPPE